MQDAFFDGWASIGRTLAVGVLAYAVVIVFLRVSGLRTLSKMNAFDFIVTIALGSTLASVLVSGDVPLVNGLAALGLLIVLQYAVTWSSVRASWVKRLVTGEPRLLVHKGRVLAGELRRARVTEDEVRAAARSSGARDLATVGAVVLETDGSFSVLPTVELSASASSLEGVRIGRSSASPPSP